MKYNNHDILAAVLAKWLQPLVGQVAMDKISSAFPFLSNIESKIRSTGWVSEQWNIGKELMPFTSIMSDRLLTPIIKNMITSLPEESIPELAHGFVENAIVIGRLEMLEGMVCFETEDLCRLQRLINHNLPLADTERYCVIE